MIVRNFTSVCPAFPFSEDLSMPSPTLSVHWVLVSDTAWSANASAVTRFMTCLETRFRTRDVSTQPSEPQRHLSRGYLRAAKDTSSRPFCFPFEVVISPERNGVWLTSLSNKRTRKFASRTLPPLLLISVSSSPPVM